MEAWASWQFRHASPSTTGRCTPAFDSMPSTAGPWQRLQSSLPRSLGVNPAADPGLSWHWLHMPFATGAWTLS